MLEDKIKCFKEIYSLVFNREFKALILVAYQMHKTPVATWNDVFEGSGLKRLGASTNTVSRALKALEKAGFIRKERAPFPFKAWYRLVKPMPEIQSLVGLIKLITENTISSEDYMKLAKEVFPNLAEKCLLLTVKKVEDGECATAAFLGFLLLDFLYHLVFNMPLDVKQKLLDEIAEIKKEHLLLTKEGGLKEVLCIQSLRK